jgi:hypothetical protein
MPEETAETTQTIITITIEENPIPSPEPEEERTPEYPSHWLFHDFAVLISVTPEDRLPEWAAALNAAAPAEGMSVNIYKPTLVLFAVECEVEFLAYDIAFEWLNGIAAQLDPPVTLAFNVQPTEEIES